MLTRVYVTPSELETHRSPNGYMSVSQCATKCVRMRSLHRGGALGDGGHDTRSGDARGFGGPLPWTGSANARDGLRVASRSGLVGRRSGRGGPRYAAVAAVAGGVRRRPEPDAVGPA